MTGTLEDGVEQGGAKPDRPTPVGGVRSSAPPVLVPGLSLVNQKPAASLHVGDVGDGLFAHHRIQAPSPIGNSVPRHHPTSVGDLVTLPIGIEWDTTSPQILTGRRLARRVRQFPDDPPSAPGASGRRRKPFQDHPLRIIRPPDGVVMRATAAPGAPRRRPITGSGSQRVVRFAMCRLPC